MSATQDNLALQHAQTVIKIENDNDRLALKNSRFAVDMAASAFYQVLFAIGQRLRPDLDPNAKLRMHLDHEAENIILTEAEEN
jgi:hypothetical protein